MSTNNIGEVLGYVACSKHRQNVLNTILTEDKSPTQIASELDLKVATVSNALHDLKEVKAAVCINEEKRKDRRYLATDLGRKISKSLESRNLEDLYG